MTGRGLRGRRRARSLLLVAIAICAVFDGLLLVPAANVMRPMFESSPSIADWVPAVGLVAQALGLAWMIRIDREDPEPNASSFRFGRF